MRRHHSRSLGIGCAIIASCIASTARADLVIQAPTITATPGSSGSFDVTLTNTGSTAYYINADAVMLAISGTGINFTNATVDTTSAPYIFQNSFDTDYGQTLYVPQDATNTPPSTGLLIADLEDYSDPSQANQEIDPGQTFGLGNINYSIDPGTMPGMYSIQIGPEDGTAPLVSSLAAYVSPTEADNVDFGTSDGTIVVATPEPAAMSLVLGVASVLTLRRRRAGS